MFFVRHLKKNILRVSVSKQIKPANTKRFKHTNSYIQISEEVQDALSNNKPVVALESTIITHGMPHPYNYETALAVEEIIKGQDVIPATIGVINGTIKVGLDALQLEVLSKPVGYKVKISRRDFPFAISQKLSGGTTVSGTMIIAHKVGIPVFVTGGIGGVHRGGEDSMDISADLTELGRTPVAVISSGIKSILDIGRTLEYLETQGVAVVSFGSSKEFPAFYSKKSGYFPPYHLESIESAAKFIETIFNLELNSGVLIGVPIPDNFSIDEKIIEEAVLKGIQDAKAENVKGKDVTPFILNRVSQITDGQSLQSNIALIKNNAFIGAQISSELHKLREQQRKKTDFYSIPNKLQGFCHSECGNSSSNKKENVIYDTIGKSVGFHSYSLKPNLAEKEKAFQVTVVGGSNLDYVVNLEEAELKPKAVFFTCIDSRMIPTRFTETNVGDMFVVRNAGNLIPHSRNYPDEITTTEPAALELGCIVNNIKHVIVCGHSDCKAMNLLYALRDEEYSSQTNRRISPLKAWMCAHASSSLDKYKNLIKDGFETPLLFEAETPQRQFVAYIDPENKFCTEDKLSQINTLQQLQNVASYGFLKKRLEEHDLHIHALWFDIYTGDIYYFSRAAKQFVEINEDSILKLLREVNRYYS